MSSEKLSSFREPLHEVTKLTNWLQQIPGWNVQTYSPVQAFLIYYQIISGDGFAETQAMLSSSMSGIETYLYNTYNIPRGSAGRKPFGTNGYIFSSPVANFLDDSGVYDFLGRID